MQEIVEVERVAKKLSWKEKVDPALAPSVQSNKDEECIVPAKQRSRSSRTEPWRNKDNPNQFQF